MKKFYYDWEMECIYSEEQMKIFHEEINKELHEIGEEPCTFAEYIKNCMPQNNGCIDVIDAEDFLDAERKVNEIKKKLTDW